MYSSWVGLCWQDWRMTDDIACEAIKQMVLLLILRVGKTLDARISPAPHTIASTAAQSQSASSSEKALQQRTSGRTANKDSRCNHTLCLSPPARLGGVEKTPDSTAAQVHAQSSPTPHTATSSQPYSSLSLATSISPTHLFKTQVYTTSPLPERRMDSTVSWQRPRPHAVRSTRSSQTRPGPAR